jgi:two-component system chemotaxis sensor kinase CheA
VTEVAGRGIGLNVVREVVEKLRGEVSFATEAGQGASIEIVVPLSMSAVEVLMVETSEAVAAIPLEAIRSTSRVTAADFMQTPAGPATRFDDRAIAFRPLSDMLSANPGAPGVTVSWSALVVEGKTGLAAIGVDRLIGRANVVLRPLPELVAASPVVAGFSLNADGNPQLVLDPESLVREAQRPQHTRPRNEVSLCPLLIIDDSLTTRMLEQSILESAGYEVDFAVSGEEGLEKARSKRYGLFLVDVEMPGIDGFTFIERARADAELRDVPAILVTSRDSADDRKRGQDVGAQGYVVKGEFDQHALLERIRKLVG